MRILVLLRDLARNGVTTYNRTLARELQNQGHDVIVWPSDASITSRERHRWPLPHPILEPLVRARIRRMKPDLVFVNNYSQARFAHRLHATLGIPWASCMHNGHPPQRMAEWADIFDTAGGVVTMSDSLHELYSRLIAERPGLRVPVLLSRLPVAIPASGERPSPGALTLTYCSRLSTLKGPRCEAWLRAVALLPQPERYRIQVIGGGSHLPQLKATALALGLAVEFTGLVTDPGPWLDRSDVITGAGYALIEGLVRGCAGVGLGFGGCIGAVTEDTLGQAIAVNFGDHCPHEYPADPDTIARALMAAIAARGTPASARMHRQVRKYFDPAPIVAELVQFLERAASGTDPGPGAVRG